MNNETMKGNKKMENKEVAVIEKGELTAQSAGNLMENLGISSSMLSIYKLLLMQNTSEFVGDEKAVMGDIVHSRTAEKFGDLKTPVEVVPVKMYSEWVIFDCSGGTPTFERIEPLTAKNEGLEWDFVEDGRKMRRDKCLNIMVLLVKDMGEDSEAFPFIISFRRMSFNAGKDFATQIFRQGLFQKPMYNRTALIGAEKQKKDTNVYAVFSHKPGRLTTPEERKIAEMWVDVLKNKAYTVDNSDVETETTAKAEAPKVAPTVIGGENELY